MSTFCELVRGTKGDVSPDIVGLKFGRNWAYLMLSGSKKTKFSLPTDKISEIVLVNNVFKGAALKKRSFSTSLGLYGSKLFLMLYFHTFPFNDLKMAFLDKFLLQVKKVGRNPTCNSHSMYLKTVFQPIHPPPPPPGGLIICFTYRQMLMLNANRTCL